MYDYQNGRLFQPSDSCGNTVFKTNVSPSKRVDLDTGNLPAIFCRVHYFYSEDIEVDFVIGTNTNRIYSPSYD